jgi:hypothetical protein
MENDVMKAFAEALAPYMQGTQYKHNLPVGYTIGTNRAHGPGGVFSYPGIERDIFSTRVTPQGLMSHLPFVATNDIAPVVGYLTGFTAGSGEEPEGPCDFPPGAGNMKSCLQGSVFARVPRQTSVLDISGAGERINRGEMFDLQLVNDPLSTLLMGQLNLNVPNAQRRMLANELISRWVALGVEFEQVLGPMVYTGNPANNTAQNGYMEYLGLQGLVTTNHTDIITGASCPSLDSDVKDFNYHTVTDNAAELFRVMTTMFRYVQFNATRMNMKPVQWVWLMTEQMFREITDIWPCIYASYGCNSSITGEINTISGMEARKQAIDMFNNNYLLIDNIALPVIVDDAIPSVYHDDDSDVPEGCVMNDIYLLPLTVKGNIAATKMEYFDFRAPNAAQDLISLGYSGDLMWSDNGKYLWTTAHELWCLKWVAVTRPRLRLMTPHLAARLQNVVICPLQHFRQPFADQEYFVDGGNQYFDYLPYSPSDLAYEVRGQQ